MVRRRLFSQRILDLVQLLWHSDKSSINVVLRLCYLYKQLISCVWHFVVTVVFHQWQLLCFLNYPWLCSVGGRFGTTWTYRATRSKSSWSVIKDNLHLPAVMCTKELLAFIRHQCLKRQMCLVHYTRFPFQRDFCIKKLAAFYHFNKVLSVGTF